MDVTVYLPDELGRWAKDEGLKLSRMLRRAVEEERDRREWLDSTTAKAKVHEVTVENTDGDTYTVRLYATLLATDERETCWLYLTEDARVFVYDEIGGQHLNEVQGAHQVEGWRDSDPAFYLAAMKALGEDAVIEIGRA